MTDPKYNRRPLLDPAVADVMESMQKKILNAQLPRKKREQLARERAKIEARRDSRTTYDLPPELREAVRTLAEEQGVPASQLASLALIRFMEDVAAGKVDLDSMKEPSRSPRYDWNLKLSNLFSKIRTNLKR